MRKLHGSEAARALHQAFPAVDLHADPLMWSRWVGYDLLRRHDKPMRLARHVDVPRLQEGGVGAQFFGLVSLPVLGGLGCFEAVEAQLDLLERVAAESGGALRPARTAEEVIVANREGGIAALRGIEGAHALRRLDDLDHFARRGVRYLGLAHFSANAACFPCVGKGRDDSSGLTAFGRELVERCLHYGVIIDLAHINKRGFMEVCAMARAAGRPVIDSHTGVMGVHGHLRNIDDDQLYALADTGGVAGVIFAPVYLGGNGISSVVRHLEHMERLVGAEHFALGSDYDGMVAPVPELADVSMLPNLTDALLQAGWTFARVGKLLRANALRVLADTPSNV